MGRYYYGDIEGKFWFAVQDSNAADRFGVKGVQPSSIEYFFTKEDLPKVQEELKRIKTGLGEHMQKIKNFFDTRDGYTKQELADALEVPLDVSNHLLSEYADYKLGKQIEEWLLSHDTCSFEGEL